MAGNSNSGRQNWEKPITDALRLALKQNDQKALNNMISNVVAQAQAGQPWAVQFISERLEGRAVQQIESHNVNENHYVRAPEKASADDWKAYLEHKAKPAAAAAKPVGKPANGSSNGAKH